MGGCISIQATATAKLPQQTASVSKDGAAASAPSSNRSSEHCASELSSHMIRERHRNVWNYYEEIRLLGEGSIGEVHLVRRRKGTEGGSAYSSKKGFMYHVFGCCSKTTTVNDREFNSGANPSMHSEEYALKCIQLRLVQKSYLDELRNEIDVLRSLDHPNIVKAYEVYETKRNIYVLMEYCSGGDLYARAPYTESTAANLMSQLCSAIAHMHKNNIVHRDLKCENIMFESKENPMAAIKVLDFGLSKKFLPGMAKVMTEGVGTLYTMAPQVLQGIYSSTADCWSLGVIAYVLLSQKKPFASKSRSQTIHKITKCKYNFDADIWKSISQEAKDFVSCLIVYDPFDRFSAQQALDHPWLKNNAKKEAATSVDYMRQASLMNHIHDSIVGYGRMSELRRIASVVVAHKSSAAEILDMRTAFESFDTTKDGVISIDEFKAGFSQFNYTDEEINEMFSYLDVNGCNEVTYTEFIAATLDLHGRIEEKRLAEAFDLIDDDDSGYISKEDLVKLLGKQVPSERIQALIKQADFNGDGRISFSEFLQLFRLDNTMCTVEAMGLQSSSTSTSERTNKTSLQRQSTSISEV